jgi:hypothetical protein
MSASFSNELYKPGYSICKILSWESPVGKAAGRPGIRFTARTTDFLFSETFGMALGPTKPPIYYPGIVPSGQAVCLSTQPHLLPRLRANHTPTPDFVACMVTNLPFISSVCPHVFYTYVKRGSCTSQCTHTFAELHDWVVVFCEQTYRYL